MWDGYISEELIKNTAQRDKTVENMKQRLRDIDDGTRAWIGLSGKFSEFMKDAVLRSWKLPNPWMINKKKSTPNTYVSKTANHRREDNL